MNSENRRVLAVQWLIVARRSRVFNSLVVWLELVLHFDHTLRKWWKSAWRQSKCRGFRLQIPGTDSDRKTLGQIRSEFSYRTVAYSSLRLWGRPPSIAEAKQNEVDDAVYRPTL